MEESNGLTLVDLRLYLNQIWIDFVEIQELFKFVLGRFEFTNNCTSSARNVGYIYPCTRFLKNDDFELKFNFLVETCVV